MKKVFLLFLAIVCHSILFSQQVTSADLLRTATSDERLQLQQQLSSYARSLNYKSPLLRKVEARVGFNGSTIGDTLFGTIRNEDFYGIVLAPNSLRERKRQAALQRAQIGVYDSERAVILSEIMLERCETMVGLHFNAQLVGIYDSLLHLLDIREMLLHKMLDEGLDVKVKDILNTDDDRNDFLDRLRDRSHALSQQQERLRQFLPEFNAPQWNDNNYIRTATLRSRVETLRTEPAVYPELGYTLAKTRFAAADVDLENADNRQIFSFVQIGYEDPVLALETPKNRKTFNNFSLRFGFQLPLPGNNNLRRSESALKWRETQNAAQTIRLLNEKAVDLQQFKVVNLLDRYQAAEEKSRSSLTNRMLTNSSLQAHLTPVEVIDLRISQQKKVLQLLEMAEEIHTEYLELLELKGVLGQEPVRDYFSESGF